MVLTNEERHEIAEETAEFWKYNCTDEEFYYNCRDTVHDELEYNQKIPINTNDFNNEYKIIMNLIEEIYSKDNWKAKQFFNEKGFKNVVIVQYQDLTINDITIKNVWSAELQNDGMIFLYNAIEEEQGHISSYDIIDIKIGD